MEEGIRWWTSYVRIFALNTPFGSPVKFTIGVTAFDGERTAAFWRMQPYDVVDAYGRCAKQVQTDDKLIAIEWLAPLPNDSFGGAPAEWSARPAELPQPPKSKR